MPTDQLLQHVARRADESIRQTSELAKCVREFPSAGAIVDFPDSVARIALFLLLGSRSRSAARLVRQRPGLSRRVDLTRPGLIASTITAVFPVGAYGSGPAVLCHDANGSDLRVRQG